MAEATKPVLGYVIYVGIVLGMDRSRRILGTAGTHLRVTPISN